MKKKIIIGISCAVIVVIALLVFIFVWGKKHEMPAAEENKEGTSQSNALSLELGSEVTGTAKKDTATWYSFVTGEDEGETYKITFVNTSPDSGDLRGTLYDEYGEDLASEVSQDNGAAATISSSDLEPDTEYYICLEPWTETADYTLTVQGMGDGEQSEEDEEAAEKLEDGDKVTAGSNQDDALPLPLGTKVYGTVETDAYAWFAFTTGDEAGATYNITAINGTTDGEDLQLKLYDKYGTNLEFDGALPDGVPATISRDDLKPNTVYYVSLTAALPGTVDYSLQVKNPDEENTAYKTIGTFREAVGTSVEDDGTVTPGTSPNNAALVPVGTKVEGTVKEGTYAWFEFITGEDTDEAYKISIVNKTQDGEMQARLYDEYGTQLEFIGVRENGETKTISEDGLKPDTAYYVCLTPYHEGSRDYSLIIQAPEEKSDENTFVFETPFEINETQIQFVPDKAEFIDEAKAEEVLKPVAQAILAAPDHSVMIAGTTATYGDQASSVTLSGKRAEAVKQLLADVYNVPESQMVTIGLGYELDPFERGQDVDSSGNLVESEAAKNRRVVVLDADDPIARELLAGN